MSDSLQPHGLYSPWNSPGQNTRVGSLSFLQGIFPTQGLDPGLPHCRWIIYQLSHKGSPRILEWVAYPFSSRSSWPRNWIGVSCIAGEGNGTPLQYSCLDNPMDGGAWGAAVHGVLRVGHDWAASLSLFTFMHWRRTGNPLQYSCLENPRDGRAWWAAIYGVARSQTRLKWLSSSSSSSCIAGGFFANWAMREVHRRGGKKRLKDYALGNLY